MKFGPTLIASICRRVRFDRPWHGARPGRGGGTWRRHRDDQLRVRIHIRVLEVTQRRSVPLHRRVIIGRLRRRGPRSLWLAVDPAAHRLSRFGLRHGAASHLHIARRRGRAAGRRSRGFRGRHPRRICREHLALFRDTDRPGSHLAIPPTLTRWGRLSGRTPRDLSWGFRRYIRRLRHRRVRRPFLLQESFGIALGRLRRRLRFGRGLIGLAAPPAQQVLNHRIPRPPRPW